MLHRREPPDCPTGASEGAVLEAAVKCGELLQERCVTKDFTSHDAFYTGGDSAFFKNFAIMRMHRLRGLKRPNIKAALPTQWSRSKGIPLIQ